MLYRYVKAPSPLDPPTMELAPEPDKPVEVAQTASKPRRLLSPKLKKIIPPAFITLGSLLIANVAWPIISHELITAPKIRQEPIISPLQDTGLIQTIGDMHQSANPNQSTPQVLGSGVDYTDAHNWFPTANYQAENKIYDIPVYKISIPAVDVEDAQVIIGGEDLSQGLIHFPGTSIPGQLGSPVIFGHSMLRQFYNPAKTNPDRYLSIFSKIMLLEEDDEIFIDYDGIRYTYKVKEKVEVKPEDVFILQQRLNNRELKLITCTPEGTYLRRGVIVAQLSEVF